MNSPTAQPNEEARYWNEEGGERWVRHIDRLERMLENFSTHLLAAVAVEAGERVLDIGCGGGPTTAAYAAQSGAGGYVLGVDISQVILKLARQRFATHPALEFRVADAATEDFGAERFDVITSRYGVMFFPAPEAAFTNLYRAAKPGARLRFLCWRGLDENPWMGAPARAAFSVLGAPEKQPPGTPGPFSLADPKRLHAVLEAAGFTEVKLEAVDEPILIGSVDDALEWLSDMGPAARPLAQADATARTAARDAMRTVLAQHDAGDGVRFDGAAWLVSASK